MENKMTNFLLIVIKLYERYFVFNHK